MTDRAPIRVEVAVADGVECHDCLGDGMGMEPGEDCETCGGVGQLYGATETRTAAPGSLTEAMMELAEAVDAAETLRIESGFDVTPFEDWSQELADQCAAAHGAVRAALSRVRKIRGEG